MTRPSPTRDALVAALRAGGPMTAAELAVAAGLGRSAVDKCLSNSRRRACTDYFRVTTWRSQPEGQTGRQMAVYDVGPGPDAETNDRLELRKKRQRAYARRNREALSAKKQARRVRARRARRAAAPPPPSAPALAPTGCRTTFVGGINPWLTN